MKVNGPYKTIGLQGVPEFTDMAKAEMLRQNGKRSRKLRAAALKGKGLSKKQRRLQARWS